MAHRRLRGVAIAVFILVWMALLPSRIGIPQAQSFIDDAGQYNQTGLSVARSWFYSYDGVHPYTLREPGYSVFLGSVYTVFGESNRLGIFFMQALLFLLAVLYFVRQTERSFGDASVATASTWLLLTLPSVFHTVYFVYRESVTLSLMLFACGLLFWFQRMRSWPAATGIGVLFGAIALTHFSFVFFPLFLLPLFWLWKIHSKFILPIVVLPFLCVMLWAGRNALYDGKFRVIDSFRTSVMWYVRGEQAERVTGLEAARCLWSEYISRDWTGRSSACSFNGLMHAKWPLGEALGDEPAIARAGQGKIFAHFPNYLWFSVWEIVELHLPYVNGWGVIYNALAALSSIVLYIGCLLSLPFLRKNRLYALPVLLIVYTIAAFVLTDATPRYLMPVIFCYAFLAAVGYCGVLHSRRSP